VPVPRRRFDGCPSGRPTDRPTAGRLTGSLRPVSDPRHEIEALLFRYAALIDAGDFAGVGELFAHGRITTDDGQVVAEGAAAVVALYEATTKRHADGTPRTHHVTTNVIVEVAPDGRSATARSAFTVLQQTDEVALQPVVAGRYRDRFEFADGQWRFTERCMRPQLFGDLHDHLLFDPTVLTEP
jgi:3-phenylpropionate/cinnamic acid dioxygenase small subunit